MTLSFEDKVALVTGASFVIGHVLAVGGGFTAH